MLPILACIDLLQSGGILTAIIVILLIAEAIVYIVRVPHGSRHTRSSSEPASNQESLGRLVVALQTGTGGTRSTTIKIDRTA